MQTMAETIGPQMDESEFDSAWAEFEAEGAMETMDEIGEIPDAPITEKFPELDIPDAGSGKLTREQRDAQDLMASLGL
jgi:hypothetical protein